MAPAQTLLARRACAALRRTQPGRSTELSSWFRNASANANATAATTVTWPPSTYTYRYTTARRSSTKAKESGLRAAAPPTALPNVNPNPNANANAGLNRGVHGSAALELAQPMNPDPRENPNTNMPPRDMNIGRSRFADFELKGRVIVVTGAARGLGLALAEAACEVGAKVYCLDIFPEPGPGYEEAQRRVVPEWGGSLAYRQQNVTDTDSLDAQIASIAAAHGRLDGVVAAAGIQQITPAADYNITDLNKMMSVNYSGVFMTATAAARQMFRYKCHGSIVLVASVSGSIANRGLVSPVYNSSKAAVVQLARNLAMEWSPVRPDGTGGIRVNCLSPGNILTPMVRKNFEEVPGLREQWENANMMGRLAETHEFKGGTLFLLGNASSFMTGNNLVIDGGLSAW